MIKKSLVIMRLEHSCLEIRTITLSPTHYSSADRLCHKIIGCVYSTIHYHLTDGKKLKVP